MQPNFRILTLEIAFNQQSRVQQDSHFAPSVAARLEAISLAVSAPSGARARNSFAKTSALIPFFFHPVRLLRGDEPTAGLFLDNVMPAINQTPDRQPAFIGFGHSRHTGKFPHLAHPSSAKRPLSCTLV